MMAELVKYCECCGKPMRIRYRECIGIPQSFLERRFCSTSCANQVREIVSKCRPGRGCFRCPYSDCRAGNRAATAEEIRMLKCAGDTPPGRRKPSYYITEAKVNIELCLREIEEEKDYE